MRRSKTCSLHKRAGSCAMSDFRNNELVQLTLCRVREFLREPEAIFWTLVFPVVMALGLGIAFRNKGPDKVFIGVVQGGGAQHMVDALRRAPDVEVRLVSQQEADDALRKGSVALVVATTGNS